MDKIILKWLMSINFSNNVAYNRERMNEMATFVNDIVGQNGTGAWTLERIKTRYGSSNDRECAMFILSHLTTTK